jgi:hypothetical protein
MYDISAAMGIEQIGAAEVVKKRLAIVAVTDHAVDRRRRDFRNAPEHLPTAALELGVSAHSTRLPGVRGPSGSTVASGLL